jgi:hypothetical protein
MPHVSGLTFLGRVICAHVFPFPVVTRRSLTVASECLPSDFPGASCLRVIRGRVIGLAPGRFRFGGCSQSIVGIKVVIVTGVACVCDPIEIMPPRLIKYQGIGRIKNSIGKLVFLQDPRTSFLIPLEVSALRSEIIGADGSLAPLGS